MLETNAADCIRVLGARTHNLRNLDVEIPLGNLTSITGVSGSGKSSLAFDTIYAEGLHRYLSTVSPQTREALQKVDRPDVDLVEGLPPTLGIQQRNHGARRRSTLATIADLYDYLRLLYARLGRLHCPHCSQEVTSQSRESIVNQVMTLAERTKIIVLSPVVRNQVGSHTEVISRIGKDGFVRARIDGQLIDVASPPELPPSQPHSIEVVIDRLILKPGIQTRVEESIDLALQIGQGQCILSVDADGQWQDRFFSSLLACISCGVSFPTIEPGDFSFNSPRGACPTCQGLGTIGDAPQESKLKENEASVPESVCPDCKGQRLAHLPLSVLINGISIGELTSFNARQAIDCTSTWNEKFQKSDDRANGQVARHLIPEVTGRLQTLIDLGLDYISLNRAGDTLSAGEFQRARLTASLGSQLTGVCYVIDEPTAGLHAVDTSRLMKTLLDLRDQGNTLIVVEHDLEFIKHSDLAIEIGPGAGVQGGQLTAFGSPRTLLADADSMIGRELRRRSETMFKSQVAVPTERNWLELSGASRHNLRDVTVRVPLQSLVCVSGVSGSGKTSLILETLVPAVRKVLRLPCEFSPDCKLVGGEKISRLVVVDQRQLGRSSRSSPATFSGIWDEVRRVFAKTKESRIRGFTPRRFSPQHAEGRCSRCRGKGVIRPEGTQLIDWSIQCPDCRGSRFNRQTLNVRYRGLSVADVLNLSFSEASDFFENLPRLHRPLRMFCDLGLGYLQLGQPAATLSGGEAQRIKLATELWKSDPTVPTLFVLDEPTSGLHAVDVAILLEALRGLIRSGHSVVVIEHNLDMIVASDWLIDLGPGAGPSGGRVIFQGPPVEIGSCSESLTAQALAIAFPKWGSSPAKVSRKKN